MVRVCVCISVYIRGLDLVVMDEHAHTPQAGQATTMLSV
jgi:hypothetical protein